MFRAADDWPPLPDGREPPPREPTAEQRRRERHVAIAVTLLLVALLVGPFAGTSLIAAVVAVAREAFG